MVLATGAFFGHVVYPLVVQLAAARRSAARPATVSGGPAGDGRQDRYVSAVVPAYRELATIGPLVRMLLGAEGSPVHEVVAVVDDDRETARAARAAGAVVVEGSDRWGKSGAVNRGIARARCDVVLLLDANTTVDTATLRRLSEHVRADRLDLVSGVRTEVGRAGESMYWTFENRTKTAEHRLGGSLSLVGELVALRRELFEPLPAWLKADDLYLGLEFMSRGHRVSVDTGCVSSEPSVTPRQQLERRFRILSGFYEIVVRRPRLLLTPRLPVQMFNANRTWRVTGGPVCQLLLAALAARSARRSPLAAAWFALNAYAMSDYLLTALERREQGGRLRALLAQGLGMPPVIAVGAAGRLLRQTARGQSSGIWERVER